MQNMKLILIADDDECICDLIRHCLKDHVVLIARDGQEAMEMIEQFQPDLSLVDIVLPKVSGDTVVKAFKDRYKMVAITGHPNIEDYHCDYQVLRKPFDLDDLHQIIKAI